MTQQVTDEHGQIHEFPDDATPEEMNSAIDQIYSSAKPAQPASVPESQDNRQISDKLIDSLHKASGLVSDIATRPAKDITAGFMSGAQGVASLASLLPGVPSSVSEAVNQFDPYKFAGVENKSAFTPEGALQSAASLAVPLPPVFKAAKGAYKLAEKVFDYIHPEKYAKQLADELGGGAKNLQQVTKDIASSIKQKFADRISEPTEYYKFLDKQVGNGDIFEKPNPLITTNMDKEKPLLNSVKDLKVGDLYDNFKSKPNYRNAHALQSELGVMINDLQRGVKQGIATRAEIDKVANVRNDLVTGIKDYLNRKGEQDGMNYSNMYDTATDLYRENVAPYLSSPKLRELNRQGKTSVKNIEKIFENPHDIENPITGKTEVGPVNKILSDLPNDIKNKILFKKVGGYNGDAEKLSNRLSKSLSGDLSHLGNENIYQKINNIKSQISRKKIAKKAAYVSGVSTLGGLSLADMLKNHYQGNQ